MIRFITYLLLPLPIVAQVRWKAEYAELPKEVQDWYLAQKLTPEAQRRFNFVSCCGKSDTVKTQFRVTKSNGYDEWWWLNKANKWERVPDDVIHWGEATPTGEAILFTTYDGNPTCFYPPQSGN